MQAWQVFSISDFYSIFTIFLFCRQGCSCEGLPGQMVPFFPGQLKSKWHLHNNVRRSHIPYVSFSQDRSSKQFNRAFFFFFFQQSKRWISKLTNSVCSKERKKERKKGNHHFLPCPEQGPGSLFSKTGVLKRFVLPRKSFSHSNSPVLTKCFSNQISKYLAFLASGSLFVIQLHFFLSFCIQKVQFAGFGFLFSFFFFFFFFFLVLMRYLLWCT